MGVVGNGAAMAPATIVLTRNAPQTLAQHLSAASMEPLVPSPEAMSTFFTPLPPSKYRYYSPSQKNLDAMGTPLGSASAPGFAGDGDGVGFTIKTEKKEVRPLNLREAMSSEQRLLQNEQYRTVVQAKLRVAKAIMEKADLKQQTRYQKILMPTGITRSTNTSSMCTTTNRIMHNSFNIKRLASRQRENSREEGRRRVHNLKTEMVTSLQMAKRRLRETKNVMGDQQRKEKAETDFISAQLKLKSFEMTRHTVQGRKHVHDVMSSIQASEQGFARRFQCSQNMMVHSNLNQVVKTEHKFAQKRNKKRVEKMHELGKESMERIKSNKQARLNKSKSDITMKQNYIRNALQKQKENRRKVDNLRKESMRLNFDLHQQLNPQHVVVDESKNKVIPWAGATARRLNTYIDQANRKFMPLAQVVSASDAMEEQTDDIEEEAES